MSSTLPTCLKGKGVKGRGDREGCSVMLGDERKRGDEGGEEEGEGLGQAGVTSIIERGVSGEAERLPPPS